MECSLKSLERACSASSTSSLRKSESSAFSALHFNSTEMIAMNLGLTHSNLVTCNLLQRKLPVMFFSLAVFLEAEPKDHVAENVRRMRRIQRENKKKQADAPQPVPVKALWKSSKYDGVTSKVKEDLKKEV